jgi:hypothetical protein
MKRAVSSIALASALVFGGCADQLEQPTTQEVGEHFERGIRGEGTIGPRDRTDDPYVRANDPSAPAPRPLPQASPQPQQ